MLLLDPASETCLHAQYRKLSGVCMAYCKVVSAELEDPLIKLFS